MMMIICVKIARTCLLKRKNKNNKKITKIQKQQKTCPSEDMFFTHHIVDYIIGQHTS